MGSSKNGKESIEALCAHARDYIKYERYMGIEGYMINEDTCLKGSIKEDECTDNALPKTKEQKKEALEKMRNNMLNCARCKLHTTRTNLVFGSGNPDATIMFVGEAPGRDEDEQGLPFVGRSGKLLTKIIESIGTTNTTPIGLKRDDVYIANILKSRPPGNRNPEPDEIAACSPFLFEQIEIIKPKVICSLGTFSAHTLLNTTTPISKLRGKFYPFRGSLLLPTFHPAYLLRNPSKKADVWEDMKMIAREYQKA